MIYFLLLTAFTVSIDSFVCGFSLCLSKNKKLPVILGIALTVFVMCALTNYLTAFFADKITEKTACVGGLILILVGVYNLLKPKENQEENAYKNSATQAIITGFAVGLDGALANLSLSLMGINDFYVPIIIAVMHAVMIYLGTLLSLTPIAKKFAKIEFLPPLILILLGGYKLLGLFI
ncbi:MAG: manganese efflux pump [Clostridia bacterium]|nr:manganese efflux pump [Clostridia bacterium]